MSGRRHEAPIPGLFDAGGGQNADPGADPDADRDGGEALDSAADRALARAADRDQIAFAPGDLVGVLVPMPFDQPFDYRVPEGMRLAPGDFVAVEVGRRQGLGVVWGAGDGTVPAAKVKPVAGRLAMPPMRAEMRCFIDRAAAYTLTPLGMMLRLATRVPDPGAAPRQRRVVSHAGIEPARLTPARARVLDALAASAGGRETPADLARAAGVGSGVVRGLIGAGVLIEHLEGAEAPFPPLFGQARSESLSPEQASAAAALSAAVAARRFSTTLLYGVTGSGKTEVYLEAVAACLAAGRQALVLIPEVALTPQFLARVEARFGARPAEWHHGVPWPERRRIWHGVAEGRAQLVVGARSALFLPFADLGLIVVDEEHEGSFKQEDMVWYHARDMAVLRASIEGAAAVLASATPALETWANAEAGKYTRLDLPRRFGAARLPAIRLVDLRLNNPGRDRWISAPLAGAVEARLEAGEQALLFLNRRGYAPLMLCRACGARIGCPHCDAWLVQHRFRQQMLCHQCGHAEPVPDACPECGAVDKLSAVGPGVERLAEEVAERFPSARVETLSSDLALGPADLKARLAAIAEGSADIVIGTQMVAKGHNFPKLTLVGVIDADMGLQGGDLRAAERTFQLLYQVSGRAGRADRPGEALVQTANPSHPVFRAMITGDAEGFWRGLAEARHHAGLPPYGRLAGIIVSGEDEAKVAQVARALGQAGHVIARAGGEVLGPAPAPIARIRGRMRMRLLVRAPKGVALQRAIRDWLAAVSVPASVRVVVDVDPQSFL
ncbi:MAG: primosomal protein N' [Pseudomonadota bacterium]